MTIRSSTLTALALGLGLAQAAGAQGIATEAEAQAALFPPDGARVVVYNLPELSDPVKAAIGEQFRGQKYYGAFAVSFSGSDLVSAQAALNHHSLAAAEAAALAACNQARPAGAAACRIAAQVQPPGYAPRGLSLSADATEGFEDNYVGAGSPKALAISPGTGEWAIAKGQGAGAAAIAACARAAQGTSDCRIAVGD